MLRSVCIVRGGGARQNVVPLRWRGGAARQCNSHRLSAPAALLPAAKALTHSASPLHLRVPSPSCLQPARSALSTHIPHSATLCTPIRCLHQSPNKPRSRSSQPKRQPHTPTSNHDLNSDSKQGNHSTSLSNNDPPTNAALTDELSRDVNVTAYAQTKDASKSHRHQPRIVAAESHDGQSRVFFLDPADTTTEQQEHRKVRARYVDEKALEDLTAINPAEITSDHLPRTSARFRVINTLKKWVLPAGYPLTVHRSYLQFSIWTGVEQLIANITQVACTSAMLYSVGIVSTTATGVASTIRWVLKDGLADIARLVFNRLFSHTLDVYPKLWRMSGEVLIGCGMAFQIATSAFPPALFLPLAAAGSALKSLSYMIYNNTHSLFLRYMAISNNFADVSAKADSQQVISNLVGMGIGLGVLSGLEKSGVGVGPQALFGLLACILPFHFFATYKTCKSVELEILYQGRVVRLLHHFITHPNLASVRDQALGKKLAIDSNNGQHRQASPTRLAKLIEMPTIQELTPTETKFFDELWTFDSVGWRSVVLGSTIIDSFHTQPALVQAIKRYQDEYYLLSVESAMPLHGKPATSRARKGDAIRVVLHKDAAAYDKLKAMLNAAYVSYLLASYNELHATTTARHGYHSGWSENERNALLDQAYKLTDLTYPVLETALVRSGWMTDVLIVADQGARAQWFLHQHESDSHAEDVVQEQPQDTNSDADESTADEEEVELSPTAQRSSTIN